MKIPIFAALPQEKGSDFLCSREKEKKAQKGEKEREKTSRTTARVAYLAAGETAHGNNHVRSESKLFYFPAR
jgi:hypothetical protein